MVTLSFSEVTINGVAKMKPVYLILGCLLAVLPQVSSASDVNHITSKLQAGQSLVVCKNHRSDFESAAILLNNVFSKSQIVISGYSDDFSTVTDYVVEAPFAVSAPSQSTFREFSTDRSDKYSVCVTVTKK